MKKQVEDTDDITKEFLQEILDFIEKSLDKVKTRGDAKMINLLAQTLYEEIEFYN
jgi:hypothetical protein